MTKPEKFNDKTNRPIVELLSNISESGVDLLVSNPALRELPVVDWAFKVVKAFDGFRSWMLARKIEKFLAEPSLIAAAEARQMRAKVFEDDSYAQEVGETLLMVLDKVTDFSKPVLLAKCYAAFLNNQIDQYALSMLTHAIDISAVRDLEQFIEQYIISPTQLVPDDTLWRHRLASSGLFRSYYSSVLSGGDVAYELAPLGSTLIEVLEQAARVVGG